MSGLSEADLVHGGWYRAKRFRQSAFGDSNNDRQIIWISSFAAGEHRELQYDSDTVRLGGIYPKTTVGKFLRWARARVNADGSEWEKGNG